jgi:DNA-3-methyladenine glycosylase I
MNDKVRCDWVSNDPLYIKYHDNEWGRPIRDDKTLFGMLTLEGAQAGLSWITVLKRRQGYMQVFDQLDPEKIARYTEKKIEKIVLDARIIRHRGKITATVGNAKLFMEMHQRGESFSEFLWSFVGGEQIQNKRQTLNQVPANTTASDAMSKALKKIGFKFCGSTICYAFMQAVGMVNDHTVDCHCYEECRISG